MRHNYESIKTLLSWEKTPELLVIHYIAKMYNKNVPDMKHITEHSRISVKKER